MNTEISYPKGGHARCLLVEDRSFWFRHRNECISGLVSCYMRKGRFADVGGGNGFVAARLQDDGLDVTLIEPGRDGATNARVLRGIRRIECATLEEASPGLFDAMGAFDVIEHIEDDRKFVEQVADRLVPNGYFFATVPAYGWLWSGADDSAGHFRRYTMRSFRDLLDGRMEVLFASYFFVPLVPAIALLRALPYRLGIGTASDGESTGRAHSGKSALDRMLAREIVRIRRHRPMRSGASLIVAARKRNASGHRGTLA